MGAAVIDWPVEGSNVGYEYRPLESMEHPNRSCLDSNEVVHSEVSRARTLAYAQGRDGP
jgi:hypothetical protein